MRQGKPCPVKGCESWIYPPYLMCWSHWQQVPSFLQNAIRRYTKSSQDKALEEAERAAIAAVDAKLYWMQRSEGHAKGN